MRVVLVDSPLRENQFIEMPLELYKGDPYWIRPWNHDILDPFNPSKNKLLQQGGKANRWLLFNDKDTCIGRIAAFIKPEAFKDKVGGIGFFECINNQSAANLLFDSAKNWLAENGIESMDGPINFGDRDKWWGLLIDGFEAPTYGMNYNLPYYQALFENYGFGNYFEQYVYRYYIDQVLPQKFIDKAERLLKNPDIVFKPLERRNVDEYTRYFMEVYNAAWGHNHIGFKPITLQQAKKIMNAIRPIMDTRLMWFGFYKNQAISFFISLPEINQIIRSLNGKFGWWEKLKFFCLLKFTQRVNKIYGIIFGVIPEFQGKGIEGGMIRAAELAIRETHYTELQMNWIGSFNPKMMAVASGLQAKICKTLVTYRYHFDRSKPFEKHPTI
jgi:hypothetical protein